MIGGETKVNHMEANRGGKELLLGLKSKDLVVSDNGKVKNEPRRRQVLNRSNGWK